MGGAAETEMTMRYTSMVPPARRHAISCVGGADDPPGLPPHEDVNSPMADAIIDPACFRRTSRSFIAAADVTDVMML